MTGTTSWSSTHHHPHSTVDWWDRLAPLESEHVRLVHEWDVIGTLSIADLLITDASSVANEYALLDRPIVFIDVPELFELTLKKNARLDLETWGRRGGEVVAGVSEALAAVESGLADPGARSDVRRALVADLFYNPGHATAAAMDWISRELGVGMNTAAPSAVLPTRGERLTAIRDRLGPFARPHRRHLRAALAASVVVTAAQRALPWPLTWLVDLASGDGARPAATAGLPSIGGPAAWPIVALLAVGLVLGWSEYLQRAAVGEVRRPLGQRRPRRHSHPPGGSPGPQRQVPRTGRRS